MIDIRDGQISDLLNNSMRYDPETLALGYAIREEKRRILSMANKVRLMSSIDDLDEKVLDYLAVELKIPVYRETYPIETKRKLVAGALPFHAHKGTPGALDEVICALFGDGRVQEWFEYGGDPHHFRVAINTAGIFVTPDDVAELRRVVNSIKRLSSWLDEVECYDAGGTAEIFVAAACGGCKTVDAAVAVCY